MKTTIIALLGLGWWLAASQSWAATRDGIGTLGQPAPLTLTSDSVDPINTNWASLDGPPPLDLDLYPQSDTLATSPAAPPTGSMPTDSDVGRTSDVGASFILIGLGGGVLICLRWRMSRSSASDAISAR